jgi:hypothetical protein
MSDNTIHIIFNIVVVICFYLFFKLSSEQKKLINAYSNKNGSESFSEITKNMEKNPLGSPFYAIRKSFVLVHMIFKKTEDHEIEMHARKVRNYLYLIMLLMISLFSFIIFNEIFLVK